ncbi:hypothetical protein ACRALDRAFT_1076422 [Sodiomyces alcalophilus JCM 7366]|uniref:uncharacterized protein n=1 Tax=Sodiomyces alcalophilus JCM 7366 TaxID=591952 RepID=UPI0039B5D985
MDQRIDAPKRNDAPRRNSDAGRENMQYWTPRGVIPVRIAEDKVRSVPGVMDRRRSGYPAEFRNEDRNQKPIYRLPESHKSGDPDAVMFEIPVGTRHDMDKRSANLEKVKAAADVHRNDRGRVAARPLNDPGPFRAVVPANRDTRKEYPMTGVIYHPEGSATAHARAPLEPLGRDGRQLTHRHQDQVARRVETWPPRDQDGDDLASREARHVHERRRRQR